MRGDFVARIAGCTLEYYDATHTYIVDGIVVPSVTQIIRYALPDRYTAVSPEKLAAAAAQGTAVHEAIAQYCTDGTIDPERERMIQHFKFLCERHDLTVKANEVPLILFDGKPVAAGRCDLVLSRGRKLVGADIKHTAGLDKEYLEAQLNMYRIGFMQTYHVLWEEIAGIHLYGETRKYVPIRINEAIVHDIINKYKERTAE